MKNFKLFVAEDYFANLAKSTADEKRAQIKKQVTMSDDDPEAYEEMPGDTTSEQVIREAFSTVTATGLSKQNRQDLIDLGATIKTVGPGYYITISDSNKKLVLDYLAKHSIDVYEDEHEIKTEAWVNMSEAIDIKYWTDYNTDTSGQSGPEFAIKSKDFEATFKKAVKDWNDRGDDPITMGEAEKVKKIAKEFFNRAGWISVNVAQAMIAQESFN